MSAACHPDTDARLLAPRMALASCVRAHLWRDTTPAATLSDAQRTTWFPATQFCGLSWTLAGDGWQVDDAGKLHPIPSRCMIAGPRTRPVQYRSAGGIRCFFTAFAPDAFHALTGLDIAALTDRAVPMEEMLDEEWQALNARLLATQDAAALQHTLEDFLQPRWRAHAASGKVHTGGYSSWLENLALRAVAAGHGASLRQVERRIKHWTGQSMRGLQNIRRAETAFMQVRQGMQGEQLVWALLAQEAGYADQAHLCRETRRVTGFSPEDLRQRIAHEEAFWAYRVWV